MRTIMGVLAITWPALTDAHGQDDAAKERKRFQGPWTFIAVEVNGKNLVDDLFKDATVVVKEDRLTLTFAGGGKLVRTFKLFTDTNPRCVDFKGEDGNVSEGIYEFKDGRLKVLVNIRDGGKERPTAFADKKKSGHIYYVLERQK